MFVVYRITDSSPYQTLWIDNPQSSRVVDYLLTKHTGVNFFVRDWFAASADTEEGAIAQAVANEDPLRDEFHKLIGQSKSET